MSESRTPPVVDRRLVSHLVDAIPEGIPEKVIKAHLRNAALSHRLIQGILGVDPTRVNQETFGMALRGESWPALPIKEFRPEILDDVRFLGGQFEDARLTTVPGGETLESQKDRVIGFWTDWHFKLKPEDEWRLRVDPTTPSQVIYLENLVEDSLGCTFDKTKEEGKHYVREILDSLPKVEGLRWIVGDTTTVNRVLASHLKDTGAYLLSGAFTWTTDTYESEEYGLVRLIAGDFVSDGVDVDRLFPGRSDDDVGLFVLGVPE